MANCRTHTHIVFCRLQPGELNLIYMIYLVKIVNHTGTLYYKDVASFDTDKQYARRFTDIEEALAMAQLYQCTCSYPVTIEEIENVAA